MISGHDPKAMEALMKLINRTTIKYGQKLTFQMNYSDRNIISTTRLDFSNFIKKQSFTVYGKGSNVASQITRDTWSAT